MGLKVKEMGGDFEKAPIGVHIARCTRVIDLGTQQSSFAGQPKLSHKVTIGWELLGADRMEDGRPYLIYAQYTASLGNQAVLRDMLKGWRGRDFTAKELESFDLENILGKPCLINVVASDDGKYHNVGGVMPLPHGTLAPEAEGEQINFSLEEFNPQVFESLGEGFKKKIAQSPEFGELATAQQQKRAPQRTSVAQRIAPLGPVSDMDDDIPF